MRSICTQVRRYEKISSYEDLLKQDESNNKQQQHTSDDEESKTPLMKRIMIASVITAAIAGTIAYVDHTKEEGN